jgi:hypothetical protein
MRDHSLDDLVAYVGLTVQHYLTGPLPPDLDARQGEQVETTPSPSLGRGCCRLGARHVHEA